MNITIQRKPLKIPFDTTNFRYLLLWVVVGWTLIGLVLYLSLTSDPPQIVDFPFADKLKHFFAYSVLMGWFCQLYVSSKRQLFLAIAFCLMGISLEFIQDWGGQRYFEFADMAANTAGVFLG